MAERGLSTYETSQPWVCYHYGRTHDKWWPFWNSTRVLGRMCIVAECCVCGNRTPLWMRIPRWGEVPTPKGGRHLRRLEYLSEHLHPDRGHPISWARPLRNLAVFDKGLSLDLLAARLEADINESLDRGLKGAGDE